MFEQHGSMLLLLIQLHKHKEADSFYASIRNITKSVHRFNDMTVIKFQ